MKKLLLATTALLGAVALTDAHAAAPKVTVGGFADFQAGYTDDDFATGGDEVNFQNDTEIHFMVDGKADNGLGYGAVIELEADVDADRDNQGLNADKTFLYLETGYGRFEMGSTISAARALQVDASTFARATGGIDGDWYDFVSPGVFAPGYIVRPYLLTDHGNPVTGSSGDYEDATKISYYSPRFSGLQVGVSYTPDNDDAGQAPFSGDAAMLGATGTNLENLVSGGINYNGQFQQVGVALAATGEMGEYELTGDDYNGWTAGGNFTFYGFTVGGSYGEFDDAFGAVDGEYYTLGGAYDFGPFGTSVTWLDSELGNNDFQNLAVGVDYMLAPGLVPYAEVSFFDFENAQALGTADDDEGIVVLLGTELSF